MTAFIVSHNCSIPVAAPPLHPVVTLPTYVEPITQLEIAALLSLRNRARQLAEQVAAAEKSLKTRLESHAGVEGGEHTAELSTSSRRTVAWREVAERLGDRLYGDGKGEGYCDRVLQSTHPSQSELREYAERRGWAVAGEYVDIGISGTKEKRPELDRLMADAYRRRFDVVAVWKFDRMARSVSHLLRVLETFGSLGIHFVSLSEAIDTATPVGKMVFTVLGAVAELERSLIVERVRAGLRNAKAKGKKLGRPRVHVDCRRIRAQRTGGVPWRAIALEMGVGVPTLYRALKRYEIPACIAAANHVD